DGCVDVRHGVQVHRAQLFTSVWRDVTLPHPNLVQKGRHALVVVGEVGIVEVHVQERRSVVDVLEKLLHLLLDHGKRNGQTARGRERRVSAVRLVTGRVQIVRTRAADIEGRTAERVVLAGDVSDPVPVRLEVVY